MGMHVTDTGPFGDSFDVAMNGAPVERLSIVSFNE
jgi:hypothetical protein